jgi:hypothetical protein
VLYVTRRAHGHAKAEDLEIKTAQRKFRSGKHIPLGIFAADDDPQHD